MYFDRGGAIEAVIAAIETTNIPVGDHVAPPAAGWSGGQPGQGTFIGYTVVFGMASQVRPSTFCVKGYEVALVLQTRTFGANRKQADDIAARVRDTLSGLPLYVEGFKANPLWCTTIGAMDRMDDTDPKAWRVTDSYSADCFPT